VYVFSARYIYGSQMKEPFFLRQSHHINMDQAEIQCSIQAAASIKYKLVARREGQSLGHLWECKIVAPDMLK
jgi:hypothetical protein